MKLITKTVLVTGFAVFTVTPLFAAAHGHGTDILHLSMQEGFTNNSVEPNAAGAVQLRQNQQGNANNQTLDVMAKGLTPGATYGLVAVTMANPNPTNVGGFTADAAGNGALHFRSLGNGHGGGKNSSALPDDLNPVSGVLKLDVVNSNSVSVLTADLTNPSSLQYLIKRNLNDTNSGASGLLQIKATEHSAQFRLNASGLTPSADYLLSFNGGVVQTNTSDAGGKLDISSAPTPTNILDLVSVTVSDSSSNIVFSTTLP